MAERFALQSMGETAENVAEKWKITRGEQDGFALVVAGEGGGCGKAGAFDREIVPVSTSGKGGAAVVSTRTRGCAPTPRWAPRRADARLSQERHGHGRKQLAAQRRGQWGARGQRGVVKAEKLTPLARVVAFATAGVEPNFMGEGPIPATRRALGRASWSVSDSTSLAERGVCRAGPRLSAGARARRRQGERQRRRHRHRASHRLERDRILVTLAHALDQRGKKRGLAALCIGVGQGIAMLVERS